MKDIFEESLKLLDKLSEEKYDQFAELAERSLIARTVTNRHVRLLELIAETTHFGTWQKAFDWCDAVREWLKRTGPNTDLLAAVNACLKRHDYVVHPGDPQDHGRCYACGEPDIDGARHCDPKKLRRRDVAMVRESYGRSRGQTLGDRIAEGFRMMEDDE